MYCKYCGKKNDDGVKFCAFCGAKLVDGKNNAVKKATDKEDNKTPDLVGTKNPIKCMNCSYTGIGKSGRSIWAQVLAWLCIFFAPLITLIYYAVTPRYICPKCNSKFIQNIDERGNVVKRRSTWMTILFVIIGIAVMSVVVSIILVNITAYQQKTNGIVQQTDSWQTYNSVADQFSIDVPSYPKFDSENNISAETGDAADTYSYHFYTVEKGDVTFFISKYIYSYQIDTSDKGKLLEKMLNNFISGSGGNLISSSYTYHLSNKALDFTSQIEGKYEKGRIILVGQTPYLLIYEYPSLGYIDADYQKFINSFKIK